MKPSRSTIIRRSTHIANVKKMDKWIPHKLNDAHDTTNAATSLLSYFSCIRSSFIVLSNFFRRISSNGYNEVVEKQRLQQVFPF